MTARCCKGETATRRLASGIMPAALLVLLPKCPLCLAAWIAAATGVALPAFLAPWTKVMLLAIVAIVAVWNAFRGVTRHPSSDRDGATERCA